MFVVNADSEEVQKSSFEKFFGKQFPAVFQTHKNFSKGNSSGNETFSVNENIASTLYGINFSGKMYADTVYRATGAMSASTEKNSGIGDFTAGNMGVSFTRTATGSGNQTFNFNISGTSRQFILCNFINYGQVKNIIVNTGISYSQGNDAYINSIGISAQNQTIDVQAYCLNRDDNTVISIGSGTVTISDFGPIAKPAGQTFALNNSVSVNIPITQNIPENNFLYIEQAISADITWVINSTSGSRNTNLFVGLSGSDGSTFFNRIDFL